MKKNIIVIVLAIITVIIIYKAINYYTFSKYLDESLDQLKYTDTRDDIFKDEKNYGKLGKEGYCTLYYTGDYTINDEEAYLVLLITNRSKVDITSDFKLNFKVNNMSEVFFDNLELVYKIDRKFNIPSGSMNHIHVKVDYKEYEKNKEKLINARYKPLEIINYKGDKKIRWFNYND